MISTDNFMAQCGCRSSGECNHDSFSELDALDALVDAFAEEMKRKLHIQYMRGRSGWDNRECEKGIRESMIEHVQRGCGQEVDVANLAAMLWNFKQ